MQTRVTRLFTGCLHGEKSPLAATYGALAGTGLAGWRLPVGPGGGSLCDGFYSVGVDCVLVFTLCCLLCAAGCVVKVMITG